MKRLRKFRIALLSLTAFAVVSGASQTTQAKSKTSPTTVSVVLKPRDHSQMLTYINQAVDPSSPYFHKYLTPADVESKYGQSDSQVDQFQKYFSGYKLKTSAYPGNLILKVTGSKKNIIKAFKATPSSKNKKDFIAKTKLPGKLSDKVASVVGIYLPATKSGKSASKNTIKPHTNFEKSDQTVDAAAGKAFSKKYGVLKFADHYGLNKLYDKKLDGTGQRIGIIDLADFPMDSVSKYLEQNGMNGDTSRVHKIYTNDGAYNQKLSVDILVSQTESSLDAQQAASVAPGAQVDNYIAISKGDATIADALFLNAFAHAVGDNQDKQLSTSFNVGYEVRKLIQPGMSETAKQYSDAMNLVFEQAAIQGISIFNASGDYGPHEVFNKKPNLSIPTSAYVVQVGGTSLPLASIIKGQKVDFPKERAWNDLYWRASTKPTLYQGSGGGFAKFNATPDYQLGFSGVNTFRAIEWLKYNPKGYLVNLHPKTITGTGTGRNVPDVSANSDSKTGYATYMNYGPSNKSTGNWVVSGGTSYAAPQMAAANAVINSGLSESVGFWNPQIYKWAAEPDTPFTVLDDADNNTNLYYTGQPGKLYNQATGLGTVNFEKLYNKFETQNSSN
ncbi:S53 family peptidase [Lentilactobacillus otakiensis]|uniref:S53 family peptidase n=1 Tax=Lentilactobacillus otakiensis TaxID=481720 RepID=UPI003D163B39